MPAKSKAQQRLFGMVHAYQKGELKDASKEIKDIAKSISKKDAEDFAETKHKGLPNKVKKKKITEAELRTIIAESIKQVLNEEGIHIKDENKGKFNATKKRTGKSTEELTHSKNPVTKKRAIFAQNAKNWNKK